MAIALPSAAWSMMSPPAEAVVGRFNDAINARDIDALAALMTDDHRFVDSAGSNVVGRQACVAAWRGFFSTFPDYRNIFDRVEATGDGVVVDGRSVCSVPELAGPARWHATVSGGRVSVWRVEDPSN